LVGGLGGIGRALATWMIKHGAQNIIFASRSGLARKSAQEVVNYLENQGARVKVHACDVSDAEQLEDLISQSKTDMPPIRGVIQGAMVLKDSLFQNMTLDDYNATTRPKVDGTWNLHNLLPKDLDFFVMLSSTSGIIGNASQAQYAAASTFLDAFANYRNNLGLPAVSLDLGVILDVGYVAENEKLMKALEKQNFEGTTEEELMAMIQHAIAHPFRKQPGGGQTVTGLGTWRADGSQPAYSYPLFSHFRRTFTQTAKSEGDGNAEQGIKVRDALKTSTSVVDAAEKVCTYIIAKMSSLLMISKDEISASKAMSDYGIDSLVAVEMRNWLFREMDSTVSILELMANKALSKLSADIVAKSKLLPASVLAAAN
jgi:aryl carrier-like protein